MSSLDVNLLERVHLAIDLLLGDGKIENSIFVAGLDAVLIDVVRETNLSGDVASEALEHSHHLAFTLADMSAISDDVEHTILHIDCNVRFLYPWKIHVDLIGTWSLFDILLQKN
jgi:hypothetical protein